MRFFLKIKQNGKQVGQRRIQIKQEIATTDELIAIVTKSLNIQNYGLTIIIRTICNEHKLKIVKGWSIRHYRLRSGLPLQVQLFTKDYDNTQQSYTSNEQDIKQQKQQMGKIIQAKQQDEEDPLEISYLVSKKYEQLLTLIQNNRNEEYQRQMAIRDPSLGECQSQLYKKELIQIQKELGIHGWAAIHYAVFAGNAAIVNFLISIGADLNIKSFDQWLPIQLAIDHRNMQMINILIDQPSLNISICTARGLPLNMAVKSGDVGIVQKLLIKDVNFSAKDHLGYTVHDILGQNPNKQMSQVLQMGKRRQSISYMLVQKNVMYHNLISSFRGEVTRVKPPPFSNKQCYLCINPYQKSVKLYGEKKEYPDSPKEIIPLNALTKFKQMSKSQKSWYMGNHAAYFTITFSKNKYIFTCHYEQTVIKWITAYNQCFKQIQSYPTIHQLKRNETDIMDKIDEEVKKKTNTKNKDEMFSIFTRKENQRSRQKNSQKNSQTNMEKNIYKNNQKNMEKNLQKITQKDIKINCPQLKNTQPSEKQRDDKQPNLIPIIPTLQSQSPSSTKQCINKDGIKFADFKILKKLGQGSFGLILLALDIRNPQRQKQYALKTFKKVKLMKNKQIKYTMCQLNILKAVSHPFIVNLHFTFQTLHYAYFGLDYCPKKDMSHYLMNEVTFNQNDAMIYIGEILLALQYLHQKHNIIYRDLKPQNIMLDEEGHIKLIDFGLSKQGGLQKNFLARSFCGSPAYISPQMLNKNGVRKQSDFYCLGTVLYEMIVGEPPYFANDVDTLYNNIKTSKLTFPKQVSEEARSLLTGLLERNPEKRLGYKGVKQIKNHKFFRNLNWSALEKRQIKAPIREQIQEDDQDYASFVQNIHKDCDYDESNYRINRFLNFNFIREGSED